MINLYNQDCMVAMAGFADNQFDLAIVDPPYGINVTTRVYDDGKKWDNEIPKKEYFEELFRVSKNQIIWGGNYFLDYLGATPCYIVWDKKTIEKQKMGMSEIAWTSFKTKNLIFRQPPVGNKGFYNIDGARIHPTQKSIKLYEWLLINYAKKGDKILDTHLGSGSIAIACHNLGYDLTGYEIDTEYYKAAIKRLKQHQSQIRMF